MIQKQGGYKENMGELQHSNVVELFEAQVDMHPNQTAVIACDATLTYKELNEQANIIAHSLFACGILKGDIVGIKLSRKSYLISAILAVLKLGGIYLPIDLNYPKDRINYMIYDSKVLDY